MEIAKYKASSTNVLYLQRKHLNNVHIQQQLKEIGSKDCIIIGNISKTRGIRTRQNYLWDLKENHNQIPKLTWSIVRFAHGYSNISKRCLLCLHEKVLIINYDNPSELLNKRSELMAKCRHEKKFLLSNYKGNDQQSIHNIDCEISRYKGIMC